MKSYISNTIAFCLLIILTASCKKDFLEVKPKGALIATTVQDYDLLMNGLTFYSVYTGIPGAIMGDDIAAEGLLFQNASLINQRSFAWEDVIYQPDDAPRGLQTQLANLYACNKIISEVEDAIDGTPAQKDALKAEAQATRASIYFDLINQFGNPYKSSTAGSDLGFPIIQEADVSVKSFNRNSVQEVYDFMIKDLTSAISGLPVNRKSVTRFSRAAAEALLAKVYLFMGKYTEAGTRLDAAFIDLSNSGADVGLYDYNHAFLNPGGEFLPIGRFGPNYPGNNTYLTRETVVLKTSQANSADFSINGLVMSPQTMALYQPSDLRLNLYSNLHSDFTPIPGGLVRKYALQYIHTGIDLPDMILMQAEVRARTNHLSTAKESLELLRKNRMPAADAVIPQAIENDQVALLKFTMEERTREFAGEGKRWLDMRRLSVDPVFSGVTYIHSVYDNNGNAKTTYQLKPLRLTQRLPQYFIDGNPGMPNNP